MCQRFLVLDSGRHSNNFQWHARVILLKGCCVVLFCSPVNQLGAYPGQGLPVNLADP